MDYFPESAWSGRIPDHFVCCTFGVWKRRIFFSFPDLPENTWKHCMYPVFQVSLNSIHMFAVVLWSLLNHGLLGPEANNLLWWTCQGRAFI